MPLMRAKMKVDRVERFEESETLHMSAVCKPEGYPESGLDEDNTFATFTPSADLTIHINNPALVGKVKEGDAYYLDFTKAE
ncbi:hypothetical protein [Spongiibacter tropicus]|uniref:hypothetical protein n=1 Tax=Spongiibacter tropicus TaxID=454602 RepID=UPI0035BE7E98